MDIVRQFIAQLLARPSPRQTSIGLNVPHPQPKDKIQALANLDYVQREIEACEKSIEHAKGWSGVHILQAEWLLHYVKVALAVAKDADTEHAIALSDTGLAILPKINPYADRSYECVDRNPGAYENRGTLRKLASEYKRGAIALGKAILEADPNASNGEGRSMREDPNDLLSTSLPV